mmetsp:Transcript_1071/g.2760  ORF Transcript_1071/g.2760 Transcript_1071/m.2760 type:complete len:301 (-) Transcript_1071:110-1012(-)
MMMHPAPSQKTRLRLLTMAIAVCSLCLSSFTAAFAPPPQNSQTKSLRHLSPGKRRPETTASIAPVLHAKKSQQPTADFEYQELQIQMDAMKKQNVKPSQLDPSKRNELRGYVEEILARRLPNQKTVDSAVPLPVRLRSSLPGTKWRMAFTTQTLMAEALPKDATITLEFASGTGSAATGSNKVDYGLDFFKTLALSRLVAKSTYSVLEPQANGNPGSATVEITYDKIVTDVMGFTNLGIGMFGMLKGRSTYIQTVYFDNKLWIESGIDQSNFGETYYNVYAREDNEADGEEDDDDDDWQK